MRGLVCFFTVLVTVALAQQKPEGTTTCPPGSQCIALNKCPPLKSLALKLETTTQTDKKLELLNDIKKHLCGDLSNRVQVCCTSDKEGAASSPQAPAAASAAGPLTLTRLSFHTFSGTVEIKDPSTLVIRDFVYDGLGPDAFFIVGKETPSPGVAKAIPVPYPALQPNSQRQFDDRAIPILPKFAGQTIELVMPDGVKTGDLKWLSLWCRDYNTNFGQVIFNK